MGDGGTAASLSYRRNLIRGLSGTAAVGLDGISRENLDDFMSASACSACATRSTDRPYGDATMFDDFYGLTGKPFQLTPDPAFYFRSTTHGKALSYLGYGLAQGEGFIVITGEVGAGKSTLVAHLMGTIDPQQLTVAQIVTSKLDDEEIVHVVAQSFGSRSKATTRPRAWARSRASCTTRRAPGGAAC
jgi:type II secretory pathway predicted ATPase ExeA